MKNLYVPECTCNSEEDSLTFENSTDAVGHEEACLLMRIGKAADRVVNLIKTLENIRPVQHQIVFLAAELLGAKFERERGDH